MDEVRTLSKPKKISRSSTADAEATSPWDVNPPPYVDVTNPRDHRVKRFFVGLPFDPTKETKKAERMRKASIQVEIEERFGKGARHQYVVPKLYVSDDSDDPDDPTVQEKVAANRQRLIRKYGKEFVNRGWDLKEILAAKKERDEKVKAEAEAMAASLESGAAISDDPEIAAKIKAAAEEQEKILEAPEDHIEDEALLARAFENSRKQHEKSVFTERKISNFTSTEMRNRGGGSLGEGDATPIVTPSTSNLNNPQPRSRAIGSLSDMVQQSLALASNVGLGSMYNIPGVVPLESVAADASPCVDFAHSSDSARKSAWVIPSLVNAVARDQAERRNRPYRYVEPLPDLEDDTDDNEDSDSAIDDDQVAMAVQSTSAAPILNFDDQISSPLSSDSEDDDLASKIFPAPRSQKNEMSSTSSDSTDTEGTSPEEIRGHKSSRVHRQSSRVVSESESNSSETGEEKVPDQPKTIQTAERILIAEDYPEILELFSAKNLSSLELEMYPDDPLAMNKFYRIKSRLGLTDWNLDRAAILDHLAEFVKLPVAIGFLLKCRVFRDRRGMDRGMFPAYVLHLENEHCRNTLLMTARKRKKSTTTNYIISVDPLHLVRKADAVVGKVRGNLLGTQFSIFDGGDSPEKYDGSHDTNLREELGSVDYVSPKKGPRKMKFLIPAMISETRRFERHPDGAHDTLAASRKKGVLHGILELQNKAPVFNSDSHSFVLNFQGRVTQASIKNFQVVHAQKEDYTILQFGRVSDDVFSLDIKYPLCPLQAFGIVLSSFSHKIACE